jgi:signal transduction histidine kinase
LRLPEDREELRRLRHDLRTPINPILGYCELIVEEAGDAAPEAMLAGLRRLHAGGRRMLRFTNELFSESPSPLHQLTCWEILHHFQTAALVVTTLCEQLERQATAAALPVAAQDLQRIGIATGRWRARIEELLADQCQ